MNYQELNVVRKLKKTAGKAIESGKAEKAMAAMAVAADILYHYNQIYWDKELEDLALSLAQKTLPEPPQGQPRENTVLFYDGFGFDDRGLVLIYLKALAEAGFQVTYVTVGHARDHQPRLAKAVEGYPVHWIYLPTAQGRLASLKALHQAFADCRPQAAFFYTLPYDLPGAMAFDRWKGFTVRYQVDLTDHAFWMGKYAFDYCLSLRKLGASIAVHYREIPQEQIRMLPYYAPIDKEIPFEGFPFPAEGKKVIFSGGDLYKTLGDPELTYYKMVRSLLDRHPDTVFLYAGRGDDSQLNLVEKEYPGRVFHISERKDLYQVLHHAHLYLNTYPMFGGMMMNYAALAGRPPLTLKHDHDADGLLFNQENLRVEFDTPDQLLEEADRLLSDPAYRESREEELVGSVITKERFTEQLKQLVETQTTQFAVEAPFVDTSRFRQEYLERFTWKSGVCRPFGQKQNLSLAGEYPLEWLRGYWDIRKK